MDGNPPPGPQASCRLARRANPTPLADNHRKHHHRHPQKPCQETWMLGRTRLAATVARMESRTLGGREPSSCPRRHLPRRRPHAPNAPANNAITLAIIIRNKRKLRKPFNSFPPWQQAQAGPARNHKTRLTAPFSPTETASFRARQPRPLARPGYADQSRPAPQQRVSKSQNRSLERVDPRRDQDSDHITSTSMRSLWLGDFPGRGAREENALLETLGALFPIILLLMYEVMAGLLRSY